jgi:hypothetical protein
MTVQTNFCLLRNSASFKRDSSSNVIESKSDRYKKGERRSTADSRVLFMPEKDEDLN